jgi:hypothetical protein
LQDLFTRAASVVVVFLAGLTFIEDTQQCDIVTGSNPRVEVTREGPFDAIFGAEGIKVYAGNVTSVTVA